MKKRLLIVFHSQSGRNETLALACWQAVLNASEVDVRLLRDVDACAEDVIWCDGLLMLTPENFGNISGGMKCFLDRVFYPLERAEKRALPYMLMLCTGNDGSQCDRQIERIMSGIGARKVQESIYSFGEPDAGAIDAASQGAEGFAAGLAMGIF